MHAVALFFFAFSTILGWNMFGKVNITYLFGKKGVLPYTIISLVFIFLGTMMSSDLVWELTDTDGPAQRHRSGGRYRADGKTAEGRQGNRRIEVNSITKAAPSGAAFCLCIQREIKGLYSFRRPESISS